MDNPFLIVLIVKFIYYFYLTECLTVLGGQEFTHLSLLLQALGNGKDEE